MGENTLVTFLLPSVHHAGSVDLYGSWDNFSRPYPMTKDTQLGHGHWYGCHEFRNVICDGDPSNCTAPEDRPLKMGGTYWYFYKRDGNSEFHNPNEPSTASCPLIPGQRVNELYIPRLVSSAFALTSASDGVASGLTMDLRMRWRTPQPPRKLVRAASTQRAIQLVKSRERWFAESLGRLETAVTEHVITGFIDKDFNDSQHKPRRLPRRKIRTPDELGRIEVRATADLQQSSQVDPRQSVQEHYRPRSRPGGNTRDQSRNSGRTFSNPFEKGSNVTHAFKWTKSHSLKKQRSELHQATREQPLFGDHARPLSAPDASDEKPDLDSTLTLPRRSRSQMIHNKYFNAWRTAAVVDSLQPSSNKKLTPFSTLNDLKYDPHHLLMLEVRPGSFSSNMNEVPSPKIQPSDHYRTAAATAATPNSPPSSESQSLDLSSESMKTSWTKPLVSTKYDPEHDLWTPATSPSKGQSGFTSVTQSSRSSVHHWHVAEPLSPAVSLPTEYNVSSAHGFSGTNSNVNSSPPTAPAPAPPPPVRPPPQIPEAAHYFGASQETIKPVHATNTTTTTISPPTCSESLSIGKLPFEGGDESAQGLFDDMASQRSSSSELDFLGLIIL